VVEIVWLEEALNDLEEIYNYISKDSILYARRQIDRIEEHVFILEKHIRVGKMVIEINRPEIREVVVGNYRVIYKIVSENLIHILMVHHGARDLKNRLLL